MVKKIKNKRLRFFREHTLMENLFSFFGRKQKQKNNIKPSKNNTTGAKQGFTPTPLFVQSKVLDVRSDKVKRWEQTMLNSYSETSEAFVQSKVLHTKQKNSETTAFFKSVLYKHMSGAKQSSSVLHNVQSKALTKQKRHYCVHKAQSSASLALYVPRFYASIPSRPLCTEQRSYKALQSKVVPALHNATLYTQVCFAKALQPFKSMQQTTQRFLRTYLTQAMYGATPCFARTKPCFAGTKQCQLRFAQSFAPRHIKPNIYGATPYTVPKNIFDTTFERFKLQASVPQLQAVLEAKQKHGKIVSPYKNILCESRKLRFLYGNISKRDLSRAIAKIQAFPGVQPENLLCVLESRLDVSLQRSGFCSTINCAKQMILSNKVHVNNKKIYSPGYQLKAGDVIAIQNVVLFGGNKKRHAQSKALDKDVQYDKAALQSVLLAYKAMHTKLCESKALYGAWHAKQVMQKKLSFAKSRWRFKGSPFLLSLFTFSPEKMVARFGESSASCKAGTTLLCKDLDVLDSQAFQSTKQRLLRFVRASNLHKQKNARHVLECKDNVSLGETLLYLCYVFFLKKELQCLDAKNDCFKEQKKETFFKYQYCLAQKITKPLHLEISYKSLCIIFLYPPQRVCLPVYVDLDSVLKRFRK